MEVSSTQLHGGGANREGEHFFVINIIVLCTVHIHTDYLTIIQFSRQWQLWAINHGSCCPSRRMRCGFCCFSMYLYHRYLTVGATWLCPPFPMLVWKCLFVSNNAIATAFVCSSQKKWLTIGSFFPIGNITFKTDDQVTFGEIVIPIFNLEWNNKFTVCYDWLWEEYTWDADQLPGANSFLSLVNIQWRYKNQSSCEQR